MKVTKEQAEEGRKLLEDLEKKLADNPDKPPLQVSQPAKWDYGPGNDAVVPGANYEPGKPTDGPDSNKADGKSEASADPAKKA
jgi:hypothetical protein